MHSKTKHIPINFHFLREHVTEKNIKLEYVGTKEQVADIFTKPLPRETFRYSEKNWESYYLLIELIYLQQHNSMTRGAWKKYPFPLMPKGDKNLNKVGKRSMI